MSVEDPNVIDFVAHDPKGEVVLVMVEGTNGTGAANACSSFRKKINNYAAFATDGELVRQYPDFAGKPVRLELRCGGESDPRRAGFWRR